MATLTNTQFKYLGIAALIGLGVAYWGSKKAVQAVTGAVTGDNALTNGTPYQGAGIAGTIGAATNQASGGVLQSVGESIGSKLYDWFGPSTPDINAPVILDGQYTVKQQMDSQKVGMQ